MGLTKVFCADLLNGSVSEDDQPFDDLTQTCINDHNEDIWSLHIAAAPVSLHTRYIPFARMPNFGLSADLAAGVIESSGITLNTDSSTDNTDGTVATIQGMVGISPSFHINDQDVYILMGVGGNLADYSGEHRVRFAYGISLVAPLVGWNTHKETFDNQNSSTDSSSQ